MLRTLAVLYCAILLGGFALAWSPSGASASASRRGDQAPQKDLTKADNPGTPSSKDGANSTNRTNAAPKLSAQTKQVDIGGDYIACTLTPTQLQNLKAPNRSPTLTGADEDAIKIKLLGYASIVTSEKQKTFTDSVDKLVLAGVSPSKALGRVINFLADQKQFLQSEKDQDADRLAPIIEEVRSALAHLMTPQDIGCAMSILDYNETSRAYGHIIASEYIAVQVNIRNLNPDQPFVIHNIEFGISSSLDPSEYHYESGRDRIIVRSLSSAQQWDDPRNIWVHSAYGLGATLSAIAPLATPLFVSVVAIYNSAAVTSFDKYFKDESGDQLNLLNDTGFTTAHSSETVILKAGSDVKVIFVPSKQFREAWWTQPCVNYVPVGFSDGTNIVPVGSKSPVKYSVASDDQVFRAAEACLDFATKYGEKASPKEAPRRLSKIFRKKDDAESLRQEPPAVAADTGKNTGSQPASPDATGNGQKLPPAVFRRAQSVIFKRWSGNALAVFRDLSETLVAGTHIIEETDLAPSLTQIVCPTDSNGDLAIPNQSPDSQTKNNTSGDPNDSDTQSGNPRTKDEKASGDLSCVITGKNLSGFKSLLLRNHRDVTDTKTAEGSVKVDGGTSNGKVVFKVSDLSQLTGAAYDVFGLTPSGVEETTSQVLSLKSVVDSTSSKEKPSIDKVDPLEITGQKLQVITISGHHLDSDYTLSLRHESDAANSPLNPKSTPSEDKIQFDVDPSKLKPSTAGTTFSVSLLDKNGIAVATADQRITLKVSNAVPAPSSKPAATSPAKPKPHPQPATTTKH